MTLKHDLAQWNCQLSCFDVSFGDLPRWCHPSGSWTSSARIFGEDFEDHQRSKRGEDDPEGRLCFRGITTVVPHRCVAHVRVGQFPIWSLCWNPWIMLNHAESSYIMLNQCEIMLTHVKSSLFMLNSTFLGGSILHHFVKSPVFHRQIPVFPIFWCIGSLFLDGSSLPGGPARGPPAAFPGPLPWPSASARQARLAAVRSLDEALIGW